VSPAGRIQTGAIEKVFARIPDRTTDPGGYIVKRNGKLFPTEKLTAELQAWIGIELASDGSIIEGVNVNNIGFTEKVAFHQLSQKSDPHVQSHVTTTQTAGYGEPSGGVNTQHRSHPSHACLQSDAHRKYFVNEDVRITSPGDAVRLCREMLSAEDALDRDKEHFYVLHLNARRRVRMIEVVSVGMLTASVVHPREMFRRAISQGSYAIIIAHNHPSGEVDPSDEDSRVTKLMVDAGNVIGIGMLDHIVFSGSKAFSFRDGREI